LYRFGGQPHLLPGTWFRFRETNVFGPRLALMEYDIRQHEEEAYGATITGLFIVFMLVVAVLFLGLPS
jgi:hypothetical protein